MDKIILLVLLFGLLQCNKQLSDPKNSNTPVQQQVKLLESVGSSSQTVIPLEQVEIDPEEEVVVHGFSMPSAKSGVPEQTALANAREFLSYVLIPQNLGYQRLFNTFEVHVRQLINQGTVTYEPFPATAPTYILATIKAKRSSSTLNKMEKSTYYRVAAEVPYGSPGDVGQLLPIAHKKAFTTALLHGIQTYANATKMTSGTITVGKILNEEYDDGTCRIELAIAFNSL